MQGLNKRFTTDPAAFLRANPLQVKPRTDQNSPFAGLNRGANPPVFQFDIRSAVVGVELILFSPHPKTDKFGEQRPITAYWLDYAHGVSSVVNINPRAANYLFTPRLDGCYVGVGNTRIVHVAGDDKRGQSPQQMQEHAATALGGPVIIGFDSNPADADECTFVGVYQNNIWNWYIQGHEAFIGNFGQLQPIFNGGQTVLQLTDLRYG